MFLKLKLFDDCHHALVRDTQFLPLAEWMSWIADLYISYFGKLEIASRFRLSSREWREHEWASKGELKIPFLRLCPTLITKGSFFICHNGKAGATCRPKSSLVKTLCISYKMDGAAEIQTPTIFVLSSQPCLAVNPFGTGIAIENEQAAGHKLSIQLSPHSTSLWGSLLPQRAG